MPHLARISLYPIKSFGPLVVPQAALLPGGGLAHDREFAVFDREGRVVNGKRTPLVHGLRLDLDPGTGALCLETRPAGRPQRFFLPDDQAALDARLSDHFGQAVTLRRDAEGGFPDDKNAPGPTLISTATLEAVASWFPSLSVESLRVRFRANLEVAGVPAFWEDRLFGDADAVVPFQVGEATFHGVNPCQRCVVPPRDPETGKALPDFAQTFRARREATLPAWADRTRFNHFYRLAINTRVPASGSGKIVGVGDEVRLLPLGKTVL